MSSETNHTLLPVTELAMMELHIDTLFCSDGHGRLRVVNEIEEPPAPLYYMGRTRQGNLWRFREDVLEATAQQIDALCRREPAPSGFEHPAQDPDENRDKIRALLRNTFSRSHLQETSGPAYWIPPASTGADNPAGNVVLISQSNANLLANEELTAPDEESFSWMIPLLSHPQNGPVAAVIEQGRAVSLCFCSRRPKQATEAGLVTLADFRGKGYAAAAVGAWAAQVARQGCMPLYSTSWDNLASQAVARKLGMVFYGEDWSIR